MATIVATLKTMLKPPLTISLSSHAYTALLKKVNSDVMFENGCAKMSVKRHSKRHLQIKISEEVALTIVLFISSFTVAVVVIVVVVVAVQYI